MSSTALILSDGMLDQRVCKTAHGLILGKSRYEILGVVDTKHVGKDAGVVSAQIKTNTPIFYSIDHAIEMLGYKPDYCVIGVAPVGGKLPETLVQTIIDAISAGIRLVSGLHSLLNDHPVIAPLAKEKGVELIDIRKPKPAAQLATWSGKIATIKTPRVAVIGTDCALGKRTTAGLLLTLCQQNQISAEMIYTGQTGWLQGMHYGFILDSTLNDFVAGEMEKAILQCVEEVNPSIIFLEGQSSLRNPAGPCGAEFLCSSGAKYVILQHSPAREYFTCDTTKTYKIPCISEEIALVNYYGAKVIAITLNSEGIPQSELQQIKDDLQEKTKLPVVYPREEGVETLLPLLKEVMHHENS